MTGMGLPDHYLRLLDIAHLAGSYHAFSTTNGRIWCDELVEKGLLAKRGVFQLDVRKPHTKHAAQFEELHVYDTTVKGRELIGRPYTIDPTWVDTIDKTYKADETYGQF